jgi:hypothetical protein
MKKALTALIVLLLLMGGATWYFVSYRMDAMIEKQIENGGLRALGTRVSVGDVKTSIKDGTLTISEVTVANPPGFKNANAFSLNGIEAAVDYKNLEVRRLTIDNPEIIIEELGGETNFSMMMAELKKRGSTPAEVEAADGNDAGGDVKETPASGKKEPVIVIHHFRMNESHAAFESESLDTFANIKIDAIELDNLKGTPTELGHLIAEKILKEITQEAAVELLKAQAKKHLGDVEIKVSKKLKDLLGKGDEDSGN